jgi:hypothetical protein
MVTYISVFPFTTTSVTLVMITQLADAGNATCRKFIVCIYEYVMSDTDILIAQNVTSDTFSVPSI